MDNLNKNEFRKECIKKLKNFSILKKFRVNKYIINSILKIIKNKKINNILLYIPLKSEVDLRYIIKILRAKKINVYVPYMVTKNTFKIVPYRLPLYKKKYNIYEPNNSFFKYKVKLDLAIVPIVGYDDSFRRVGFGVGFYDRFFSFLNYDLDIIFTQICRCKSKKIITNSYDVKANYIITNKGVEIHKKGKLWN